MRISLWDLIYSLLLRQIRKAFFHQFTNSPSNFPFLSFNPTDSTATEAGKTTRSQEVKSLNCYWPPDEGANKYLYILSGLPGRQPFEQVRAQSTSIWTCSDPCKNHLFVSLNGHQLPSICAPFVQVCLHRPESGDQSLPTLARINRLRIDLNKVNWLLSILSERF